MKAAALIIWLAASVPLLAAPADELATSPVAARVSEFLHVFNGGDESELQQWIAANYADSVLGVRSAAERMDGFRQLRRDMYTVQLARVLAVAPSRVSVLLQSARDEWFQVDFLHQIDAPYKLFGLKIEHASPPGDSSAVPAGPMTEDAALDSTLRLLHDMTANDEFSGVIWIARHGKPILREAFGYADRDSHSRNRVDTKFNIGSIDKSFTRIAVERLISEGRLSPETKVGDVLPDYPNPAVRDSVTVRQLLNHTSGIPDFFGEEFMTANRDSIRTLPDYLKFFAEKPLNFSPGAREEYSNGGFIVLGLMLERLTGQNYYDHIQQTVFQPLRMNDSGWFVRDERVRNLAIGYTHRWAGSSQDSPELRPNTDLLPARGSSAGGSYASAEDLLRFANALEQGKIQSSEFRGGIGIAGGSPGVNASLETGVAAGYTVIVLSNFDPPSAERASQKVRRWLGLAGQP